MKASQLIGLLQDLVAEGGDVEVFHSKGDHSTHVIAADPYVFCNIGGGNRWVKCLATRCNNEKLEGILLV